MADEAGIPLRGWAVIGVVGRTFRGGMPVDAALLQLAHDVGVQIAMREHAVLTGGCHTVPESSVKYRALLGAASVSSEKRVRLIGILPRRLAARFDANLNEQDARFLAEDSLRWLYGNTGLESEARNEITGSAADVLIVLRGGAGTAQEVAYAIKAGRPCVFLNSWDKAFEKTVRDVLAQIASAAKLPPPCCAESAEDAVEKALAAINWDNPEERQRNARISSCNPAGRDFKDRYDKEFRKL